MRERFLSVCVGVALTACGGTIESAMDDAVAHDASRSDAAVDRSSDASEPEVAEKDAALAAQDAAGSADASLGDGGRDSGPPDAGRADSGGVDPDGDAAVPSGTPMFVIAGYQRGRAYSLDLGLTWHLAEPGLMGPPNSDDDYVLSGVSYGKGLFVAVGWEIWTSPDGRMWKQRQNPGTQWLGSVNFALDMFVGAGGNGFSAYSADGITWMKGEDRNSDASDTSAFGDGAFMAATKDGRWWRSTDGKSWAYDSDGHGSKVVWCRDHFANEQDCTMLVRSGQAAYGEGVWIRIDGGQPSRSTNGTSWTTPDTVNFDATCVTFGYVP